MQHDVQHPLITYLKFVLGGKNIAYPGVNGVFANVIYRIGANVFVDSVDQFKALVST